jgi:DNA-binding SARP family transcriptional activator/tetratricopeptide (TPR) repeat protein
MNVLTLLGAADLRDSTGHAIPAVIVQPKRLALLAFLTLNGSGRFHQRDTLMALLWPDLDAERARNGLNKSVHFLRAALGDRALVSRGERELGLDGDLISCDATRFEEAATARRYTEAMALYQADLLPGFFLSGAPEFERWLEDTRSRLRRLAVTSALALAGEARAGGAAEVAIRWARRATELAPNEEPAIRELVQALALAGDRAGAIRTFEEWSQALRRELDVSPSTETLALVESLKRVSQPTVAPLESWSVPAVHPSPERSVAVAAPVRTSARLRLIMLAGLALPIILAMVWATRTAPASHAGVPGPPPLVVLPFQTAGDTAVRSLGDGMVDLLSAALRGPAGQRTVDPRLAVNAWKRVAGRAEDLEGDSLTVRLSRQLGAAYLVTGSVVGLGADLSLSATLRRSDDGSVVANGRVSGPLDSLMPLVDQLAAQLLLEHMVGGKTDAPRRARPPLEAVRAYLDGRAAHRRGDYHAALIAYGMALDADSSFSEAAMEGMLAASVLPDDAMLSRTRRLAWRNQADLGAVDRLVLRALAGPEYPLPPSGAERLVRLDSAVTLSPDRSDLWFMLGDVLYHEGPALRIPDARTRSAAAFERALALDPEDEAPLEHLVDLAATAGNRPLARRLGERYLALHGTSERAPYIRWRVAAVLEDEVQLQVILSGLDSMAPASLIRIAGVSQLDGIRLDDGDAATSAYLRRAATLSERRNGSYGAQIQALVAARNRGRLREADRIFQSLYRESDTRARWPSAHITTAMMVGGSMAAADSEARALVGWLDSVAATPAPRYLGRAEQGCIAGHWLLRRGDIPGAVHVASALAGAVRDTTTARSEYQSRLCREALETALAAAQHEASAMARLDRLDSLAAARIPAGSYSPLINLEIARLREAAGDPAAALRAVRRRPYHWSATGVFGLSMYLYEEGRLAEQTGDTAGAIAAYRHYLALRSQPDPEAQAEADSAKQAMVRLRPGR